MYVIVRFDFIVLSTVVFWCCKTFSVCGDVGGASHAGQQPMRTLQLHVRYIEKINGLHINTVHSTQTCTDGHTGTWSNALPLN